MNSRISYLVTWRNVLEEFMLIRFRVRISDYPGNLDNLFRLICRNKKVIPYNIKYLLENV